MKAGDMLEVESIIDVMNLIEDCRKAGFDASAWKKTGRDGFYVEVIERKERKET